MINVYKNPNFANWYNVVLNGKIIDNARHYAGAMAVARRVSRRKRIPIMSCK